MDFDEIFPRMGHGPQTSQLGFGSRTLVTHPDPGFLKGFLPFLDEIFGAVGHVPKNN